VRTKHRQEKEQRHRQKYGAMEKRKYKNEYYLEIVNNTLYIPMAQWFAATKFIRTKNFGIIE